MYVFVCILIGRQYRLVNITTTLSFQWVSLVAQLVKNPPAMQETWVRSLSWEDPLEKGTVTHSNILALRIPWTLKESDTTERFSFFTTSATWEVSDPLQ